MHAKNCEEAQKRIRVICESCVETNAQKQARSFIRTNNSGCKNTTARQLHLTTS